MPRPLCPHCGKPTSMLCRNVKPISPLWNDITTLRCNHCGRGMKMTDRAIRRAIAGIFGVYLSAVLAAFLLYLAAFWPGPWNLLVGRHGALAIGAPVAVLVVVLWSVVWGRCMEFRKPEEKNP